MLLWGRKDYGISLANFSLTLNILSHKRSGELILSSAFMPCVVWSCILSTTSSDCPQLFLLSYSDMVTWNTYTLIYSWNEICEKRRWFVSDIYISLSKFQIFDSEKDMRPSSWLRCPHNDGKQRETDTYYKFTARKRHEGESGDKEEQMICRCTLIRGTVLTAFLVPSPLAAAPAGGPFAPCGRGHPSSLLAVWMLGPNRKHRVSHKQRYVPWFSFLKQLMVVKYYIGRNKEAHIY